MYSTVGKFKGTKKGRKDNGAIDIYCIVSLNM